MDITIDAAEIAGFADAMAAAPGTLQSEMEKASGAVLAEGVGYAQEYAPKDTGALAGSIAIIDGPHATGGSYGTSMEYAWMREEGGTIVPRNRQFLRFEIGGRIVFARKVTQSGSHYMQRSMESLEPRVLPAYQGAVDRTMESL